MNALVDTRKSSQARWADAQLLGYKLWTQVCLFIGASQLHYLAMLLLTLLSAYSLRKARQSSALDLAGT